MRLVALLLVGLRVSRALQDDDDDDDEEDSEGDGVGFRSGLDMFRRRLPGSLLLATSGNDTGNILGSWSTNAVASTVFQFYQGESVIANGHDFGGWIMGSQSYLMRIQQPLPFKAGESSMRPGTMVGGLEANNGKLDIGLLMTKLWTSAIVRDNIVTTFGFILNRPNNHLPADLYASLMILYNAIRLRRIQTFDVLPVLKRMSYSPPQEQFVVLFEELHRHVPAYLKSSVSVWVEALTEHRVDLNPIIRPGGGPCEVDFLASLEPSVLNVLEKPMIFKRETAERVSTTIKVLMGPLFSYVLAGLYDGSIELTQPLFALILLHLPLDQIVPHKDETERYVVDALRLNAIKHWDEVVDFLSEGDLIDPFRLVKAVLQGIANNPNIDRQIRHDSLYILPYIKASTSTYSNENYAVMSEVVGSPSIRFKLLLDHITLLMYSPDLLNLKERLLEYIRNGYISMESVTAGFIRYDYTTPYDVLISILTRIQRRLPNLSGEMLGTVKAFQVHLVFHKLLAQTPSRFPSDLIHVSSLVDAFSDPGLPTKVQATSKALNGLLDDEHIEWKSLIADIPMARCSTPRQCFLSIMRRAIDRHLIANSRVVKLVEKLFHVLDENGNIKQTPEPDKCEVVSPAVKMLTTVAAVQQVNMTEKPEEVHISSTTATAIPELENKDSKLSTPNPFGPFHNDMNSSLPINSSLLDVIPKIPELEPLATIIKNDSMPELRQLTNYFHNKTRAEALLILLETLLNSSLTQSQPSLVDTLKLYVTFLMDEYGLARISSPPKLQPLPPPDTEFPAINPSSFCLPANFEQRESLLPYTTPFTPSDILMKPIRDFITRPDLLNILGEEFKPSEFPTKFLLLRAILEKSISTKVVQEDSYLHNLLKRYLNFVIHHAEETRPSVNWVAVLDALPHAKEDHEYKHFTVLRDFILSSDMDSYIRDFEVRRYTTRGLLLKNCLRHLLTTNRLKERADLFAAIKYFVDKVYLDGFGAKSVEYIVIKQQVVRRTIDLQNAFQAISVAKLDSGGGKALKGVYKFFEKEFQPPIHLANYDLMKHRTKGEWLKAYFTYLASHPAVSNKAKQSISTIIPHILLTGPGAETVD